MPNEIMQWIHDNNMPGGYYWLFWIIILLIFVAIIITILKIGRALKCRQ